MLLNGTNSRITINDTVFSMPFGDVASVGSSLSIDSTLGSDSGTYRCVATNNLINMNDMEIGIDEENVTLVVQGSLLSNAHIQLDHSKPWKDILFAYVLHVRL